MDVGIQMVFASYGWDGISDRQVWDEELRLARLADELGFDVLWSVEHHFYDYSFCPDNLQLMSYLAGVTSHADLGTAAVILLWHDPLRVAEQVAILDHVSNGRFRLGIGRGLSRREFAAFRGTMRGRRARPPRRRRRMVRLHRQQCLAHRRAGDLAGRADGESRRDGDHRCAAGRDAQRQGQAGDGGRARCLVRGCQRRHPRSADPFSLHRHAAGDAWRIAKTGRHLAGSGAAAFRLRLRRRSRRDGPQTGKSSRPALIARSRQLLGLRRRSRSFDNNKAVAHSRCAILKR